MNFILPILFFLFGACIGSFLNVLILRLPKDQKPDGRSHCPNCKHTLGILDLVPIFSWIFLRGKCRYCAKPISSRYFWVELATGLLFALVFETASQPLISTPHLTYAWAPSLPSTLLLIRALFIVSVLVVVFMIDLEHMLILDKVIFPATIILFFLNAAIDIVQKNNPANSLAVLGWLSGLAVFAIFGAMHFVSKGKWMGFGDAKFGLFMGLATPYPAIAVNLFLAFWLGALVGAVLLITGKKHLGSKLPFGVFLAPATLIALLYSSQILAWYFHLIYLRI